MVGIKNLLPPWLISGTFVAWKHRLWLILTISLGAAIGFGVHWLWPKSYRAKALVLIEAQKVPDKYVQSTVNTEVTDRLSSISQEILSNTRLQKIVEDFRLYEEEKKSLYPEEILDLMRKNINIRLEKGMSRDRTGAFNVEFTGRQPTVVAEVTNRLVSLFLEQNLRDRALSAEGTSEFLDGQLNEAKRKLEEQERKLAEYKLKHEGSLPGQDAYINSVLSRLQQELQFVEESIARANLNKMTLENTIQASRSTDILAAQLAERAGKPEEAPRQKTTVDQLQEQLNLAISRYKPNHPDIAELRQRLEVAQAAERELAKPQKLAEPAESPQVLRWRLQAKERDDNFKTQMAILEKELLNRQKQRSELLAKIEAQQSQLSQLPIRELQMGSITRDYEISVLTYKTLLDKGQTAHISSEMERRQKGERFKVVDPAKTPEKPLGIPSWVAAIIGGVSLLLLHFGFLIYWNLRSDVLIGEWELPEDLPVLVRIPVLRSLETPSGPRSPNRPKRYRFRIRTSEN